LDANFHAKLSDFGYSRTADGSTVTELPVTVAYAPAEALGDGELTTKSDVYSLGLLMIFVITGKHPFDPKMKPLALMKAIERGARVDLHGVKPELALLIQSMVSVNAEDRPAWRVLMCRIPNYLDFAAAVDLRKQLISLLFHEIDS
jgi:serine/threonine protein kinase